MFFFAGEAKIGLPKEARVYNLYSYENGFNCKYIQKETKPVHIGNKVYIGNGCTIYEGTTVGFNCVLEDQTRVGYGCLIGTGSRLMYGAFVCDRVAIGSNCRVAGFVCDATIIGNDCTIMGQLSHKYTVADLEWGAVDEPSPKVEDNCIIGLGAQVIGGITLGKRTFVCSGAILTKNTPKNSVVYGVNKICHISEWKGDELRSYYKRQGVKIV